MRDADKWYCSLGVLALNVVPWIFHVSSPVRAVGVTAPFCLHLSIRAFAAYTQQSWTSGQVQSELLVQRLDVFRSSRAVSADRALSTDSDWTIHQIKSQL